MNPVRLNPDRPKTTDLAPLILAVYQSPLGGAGCCLHVVTDDGNYECAEYALNYARERGHPECIRTAEMMTQMTESQIARATRKAFAGEHAARMERMKRL